MLAALIASPHDPLKQDLGNVLAKPGRAHWLGTDNVGRDVLSRVIWGTRVSLVAGFVSVAIAAAVGGVLGMLAGYAGGRADGVVMRLMDAVLSLPPLVLARALGAFGWWIARRHVLPNAATPIVVQASLSVAFAILAEASLSFLGLGIQPPAASWGSMINAGRGYLQRLDDGMVKFVNNDHCLLSERVALPLMSLLPSPLRYLPLAQAVWYMPTGLDPWNQLLGKAPG